MKRFVCVFLMILFLNKAYSVSYEYVKNTDSIMTIKYTNEEKSYYVIANYYKLYFEIKVEVYFTRGMPSDDTMAAIEAEQFYYLTKYFKEIPYRPPISNRKANQLRKMYSFTILYKGRVIEDY